METRAAWYDLQVKEKQDLPKPGDTTSLDALYAKAAEITRAGSRGFYFATRHFPLDLERAAHAVYWFCHYTLHLETHAALDEWASLINGALRGALARHPVLDVFLDTVDQRAIPHDEPLELIDGVRFDLDHSAYDSFAQLRARCQRVGGMVSRMLAYVVGFREPALDYMSDLGVAIELTTLLRDTGTHVAMGRIYLPAEEMEACGYSLDDLKRHVRDDRFHALMRMQCERIHAYFQRGEPALPLLDPRGRFAVKVAFDLYRQTLRRIEASDFDVFRRQTGVPAMERAWITARNMAGPVTRRLWRAMSA